MLRRKLLLEKDYKKLFESMGQISQITIATLPTPVVEISQVIQDRYIPINDPLGQTHSPVNSDHCFHLKICFILRDFEKYRRNYGRTTCVKIVITAMTMGQPRGSILQILCYFILNSLELTHQATAQFVVIIFTHGVRTSITQTNTR